MSADCDAEHGPTVGATLAIQRRLHYLYRLCNGNGIGAGFSLIIRSSPAPVTLFEVRQVDLFFQQLQPALLERCFKKRQVTYIFADTAGTARILDLEAAQRNVNDATELGVVINLHDDQIRLLFSRPRSVTPLLAH